MSNVNIETLLYDQIETDFDKLQTMEPGSNEHKATVDELTKLMDKAIELERLEIDCKDKTETRENEQFVKMQQMTEDRKDRLVKNIISAAGIVVPTLLAIWGTKVSMKFEETGTFTTIMGRSFVGRLLPKK